CGLAHMVRQLPGAGSGRRAPRQRHAERFADDMHGVCGSHAGADARAAYCDVGHGGELADRDATRRHITGFQKYFLDIDVLTAIFAALLIAADDDDGRDIEPPRRHQLAWRCLVAGRKTKHAVEQRAFDLDLDVARDQIAGWEDIGSTAANTRNEIARSGA